MPDSIDPQTSVFPSSHRRPRRSLARVPQRGGGGGSTRPAVTCGAGRPAGGLAAPPPNGAERPIAFSAAGPAPPRTAPLRERCVGHVSKGAGPDGRLADTRLRVAGGRLCGGVRRAERAPLAATAVPLGVCALRRVRAIEQAGVPTGGRTWALRGLSGTRRHGVPSPQGTRGSVLGERNRSARLARSRPATPGIPR